MSNLAHFPKDKDSSISTVWPFALRSRWGCSQGAQRSDLWENIHQQYLQMWKTAFLVSPGSYMLLLTLRRFVSQLEVVFLLLVDCSLNYTLRSKTSVTNELFMKTQVTYFLWWLAVRGEQSNLPRGILEALFNTVMGGLIWATYIFTVKWEAGENTSLLRKQIREFEQAFRNKTEQKLILYWMIRFQNGGDMMIRLFMGLFTGWIIKSSLFNIEFLSPSLQENSWFKNKSCYLFVHGKMTHISSITPDWWGV